MTTLQFIDSMTGRLAWPIVALALGFIFRRPLGTLLARVRTLTWGQTQAKLADAANDVQETLEEIAQPLPPGDDASTAYRARIERVVQDATMWGFRLRDTGVTQFPKIRILWADRDRPRLIYAGSPAEGKYEVSAIGDPDPDDPQNLKLGAYVSRLIQEEVANQLRSTDQPDQDPH
jgi:hypothetical protein